MGIRIVDPPSAKARAAAAEARAALHQQEIDCARPDQGAFYAETEGLLVEALAAGEELQRAPVSGWTSIRTLFKIRGRGEYVENITLWATTNWHFALEWAEAQAVQNDYSKGGDLQYLETAQGYLLADEIEDGAEIYSLMRRTRMAEDEYVARLFEESIVESVRSDAATGWWTVREVLYHSDVGGIYEERITLCMAATYDGAVLSSSRSAQEYALNVGARHISLPTPQVYPLWRLPSNGDLVFSIARHTDLSPDEYISRYYITGEEFTVIEE